MERDSNAVRRCAVYTRKSSEEGLETLCEAGKVTLLHDAARYDGNTDSHHHVVCIRCHRVCDLEAPQFDRLFKNGATLGEFELLGCSVEIRALCKRCRKVIRAIAYRLQERAFGGLKPSTQRVLDRIGAGRSEATLEPIPKRRASAGTVLIREWRGLSHRVTVLDHDVVYRGRRYKSLSEVARAITGTRWSGPLFFGLKRRTKEVVNG